jgi:adenylate kinase family enzyme
MARVLVTGMSGAGKTTLLQEVASRGYLTVDTDYNGWTLSNGLWDEARIEALLAENSTLAVSGTVENQVRFYDTFDDVVLLSAPVEVLLERVRTRADARGPGGDPQVHARGGAAAATQCHRGVGRAPARRGTGRRRREAAQALKRNSTTRQPAWLAR